ncbi:MAG: alpha/beta hydrolase [Acidobacteriota bacterium]
MNRSLRMVGFALAGVLILAAALGACYQAIAARMEARRFPEPGRLIDIGGFRLQLNCTGSGSRTVILEAGLGDRLSEWQLVQLGLAKFARVCSYDRAGYGGSDSGPMPRTSARIADELHKLLQRAGEQLPFVFVGHSYGGYNVRVYAGKHAEEVAGMVLVDATQEDQYELLPEAWKTLGTAMRERYLFQARWAPVSVGLGYYRLLFRLHGIPEPYTILSSKYLSARASELASIQVSAGQARAAGTLGDKPLVVLTAGRTTDAALRNGLTGRDLEQFQRTWVYDLQPRLARLSTQGRQIIVPDSGHDMPSDRPDAIVQAVHELWLALPSPSAQTSPAGHLLP